MPEIDKQVGTSIFGLIVQNSHMARETHKDSATIINLGTKTFKQEKTPTLTFGEIILSHKGGSVWHL